MAPAEVLEGYLLEFSPHDSLQKVKVKLLGWTKVRALLR